MALDVSAAASVDSEEAAVPRNVALIKALAADPRKQYQLAGLAAINPRSITAFCAGREDPTPAQRARLAEVLGVPEEELFEPVDADA